MTILFVICAIIGVILIINVIMGNKHNEEIRNLATKKKERHSTSSQQNINVRMMDVVHSLGDSNNAHYWERFKRRKPIEASAISDASGLNMNTLSDKDAFEVVSTFLRWSENTGKPISNLKEDIIAQLSEFLHEVSYEMLESKFRKEIPKEAQTFNISQNHTVCHFMLQYLEEAQRRLSKKNIATGNVRSIIESLLDTVFTNNKLKEKMNEDMAYVLGSLVIDMVKSGDVDSQIKMILPSMTIQNIQLMNKLYASGNVDKNEFDQILEESLDKFVKQF
jgi:hypothetical protein